MVGLHVGAEEIYIGYLIGRMGHSHHTKLGIDGSKGDGDVGERGEDVEVSLVS